MTIIKDTDAILETTSNAHCWRQPVWNNHYFDVIDSADKAYWIGFIWCDGYLCIRDRNHNGNLSYEFKLSLKESDYHHLEKFNECLGANYKIHFYPMSASTWGADKDKNSMEARLLICNKHLGECLHKQYGMVARRSDCSKILSQIPKDFYKDFIRGVVDADGTFLHYHVSDYNKDVDKYCLVIGTNEDILREIEKYLIGENLINNCQRKLSVRHKEEDRDGEYKTLNLTGYRQVVGVLNYLYKDATLYLDRKYEKYISIMEDVQLNHMR